MSHSSITEGTLMQQQQHWVKLSKGGEAVTDCVRPDNTEMWSLEQRKFYCRVMQGDRWLVALKNSELF